MTNVKTIRKTAIEWVEVKDHLPKPDKKQPGGFQYILVCTKEGDVGVTLFNPNLDAHKFIDLHGYTIPFNEVVAWAYIPKPPINFDYSSIVDVQLNVTNISTPEGEE